MTEQVSDRIQWNVLAGMGILILFMAFIVVKDFSIPSQLIIAVGAVGGLALLFVSPTHPEIPFYLLTAYIPFNRILPGDFGGTFALNLTNLLCGLVILGGFSRSAREGRFWQKASLNLPILLFVCLGTISLVRGSYEYGTWYLMQFITPLKRWLTSPFLYFLTLFVVRDKRTLKTAVVIMMVCVTVVGLMAIREYIEEGSGSSIEADRIGGIAEQPNMLAAFFCYYMFILASFYLCNMSKPRYWLLLIPFLICFRGIQVTFSRGGYLAFLAGAMALSFFRSKLLFALVIVALILAFLHPALLPKGIAYRFFSTFKNVEEVEEEMRLEGNPSQEENLGQVAADIYKGEGGTLDRSAQSRLEIWRGALRMISDYPFWGTGYGTFFSFIPFYTPELHGMQMDAHNSYLIVAAEMGIPALLAFLSILLVAIWQSYRLYQTAKDPFIKAMALGFLAGLFGLFIANMFGSRMDHEEISGYFWVLCALVMRGIVLEKGVEPAVVRVASKRKAVSARRAARGGAVVPRSLSGSLRRFDELKYGKAQSSLSD